MKLATQLHLVPRFKLSGVTPPLPYMHSWREKGRYIYCFLLKSVDMFLFKLRRSQYLSVTERIPVLISVGTLFRDFSQSLHITRRYLKLDHYRLLLQPFQFITHFYPKV